MTFFTTLKASLCALGLPPVLAACVSCRIARTMKRNRSYREGILGDAPRFTLLEVKPMSEEKKSSKQKIEEELGQLLLSLLNGFPDADRDQCLRFLESTLRRLGVLKADSDAESE